MPYHKVLEVLQEEGIDTSEITIDHGLAILPVEGQYVYFAEDLRFAGAIWDENKSQWIVQM